MEELLAYAIEGRRRVKEQLKKIGGMEFYDVQLSYIDLDTMDEKFVPVLEQGGGKIIPEGPMKSGHIYTVAKGSNGMIGTFKLETQISNGNGKFTVTGLGNVKDARESVKTAEMYFRANSKAISPSIMIDSKEYVLHIHDAQGVGLSSSISMATLIAYSSASLNKHVQTQLVVLGSFRDRKSTRLNSSH